MFVNVNFATSFRLYFGASLVAQTVEKSACTAGEPCSISGSGDPLEKGMAAHSGILCWEISWTEDVLYKLFALLIQFIRHLLAPCFVEAGE